MKRSGRKIKIVACLLVFLILVFAAVQLFLKQTSLESPRFTRNAILLALFSAVIFVSVLGLLFVLIRDLLKLYFERQAQRLGAKFKTKLLISFTALAMLPTLLLCLLAYGLINKALERWFRAPAMEVLENARAIADHYYQEAFARTIDDLDRLAVEVISPNWRSDRETLVRVVEGRKSDYGFEAVSLYGIGMEPAHIWSSGHHAAGAEPAVVGNLIERGSKGERLAIAEGDSSQDIIRAVAPIRLANNRKLVGFVIGERKIDFSVASRADRIVEAYEQYRQLHEQRRIIRINYILILTLTSLVLLLVFTWFAFYLARKITVPIQALAQGAEQVAQGNLDHRVQCPAGDELALLVSAFNRMTAELKENRSRIEEAHRSLSQKNRELEERKNYIETILQNIATGVISLDSDHKVMTINRAAIRILRLEDKAVAGAELERIFDDLTLAKVKGMISRCGLLQPLGQEIEIMLDGTALHLAVTVTPIIDSSREQTGYVLVLDDLTELIRAQKAAAWQEVAKRLAHEIKNPLTPIRLSAERIRRRLESLLEGSSGRAILPSEIEDYRRAVDECVKIIVAEAEELKGLISEFSEFARMPAARFVKANPHDIIENVLTLYDGRLDKIVVEKRFAADVPQLSLDPEQMKRVFVNLIDNALEAMDQVEGEKRLTIATAYDMKRHAVRVEVADTGHGIPPQLRNELFLPYFSTRRRGTGLGLAIVRQIIDEHRGFIRVEDNHPRGAKIVIELPAP